MTGGKEGAFRLAASTRFDDGNEKSFIERAYPTAYERKVIREAMFDVSEETKDLRNLISSRK